MKAWELLEQKGWCQGCLAQDINGFTTDPDSEDAVRFCAVGALEYCYGDDEEFARLYEALRSSVADEWVMLSAWNDDPKRTKQEVIEAMKRADV